MNQNNGVIIGTSSVRVTKDVLRTIKGSLWGKTEPKIIFVSLLSIILHALIIYYFNNLKINTTESMVIEKVPERFAKLIIEKPVPEEKAIPDSKTLKETSDNVSKNKNINDQQDMIQSSSGKARAQKSVAERMARVEKKIRTVGVLGMLSGVGKTAKGPSVVDVLGKIGDKKDKFTDLDKTLDKINGLKKTRNLDILNSKLVKSKDVSISYKNEIDDLISNIGEVKSMDLAKRGNFIIQKPESIEGAASSNSKRDPSTINSVVSSHKTSIRMSYEKFMKRNPELAGKITVRFTISASGIVTRITVINNTTGNTELEQEIVRKIRMWHFETVPEGNVTVTYPFIFAPAS